MTLPSPAGRRDNGLAIAGYGSAIVGLSLGLSSTNGFYPLFLGVIGVVLGVVGWVRARRGNGAGRRVPVLAAVGSLAVVGFGVWKTVVFVSGLR